MRPNLFNFATKELSQDAFLAWLIQWASPACQKHDPPLFECASQFVRKLLSLQISPPSEITSVKVGRQWENIDVWAEINDKYLLIIEDKTVTGEHSNQLQTYKERATAWCAENNFQPVFVYLKTGSESGSIQEKIKKHGFAVFRRRDFLGILNDHSITNHIFNDFRENLRALEDEENQFSIKPIKEWRDPDWKGFYQALEIRRPIFGWEWVNPPAGNGFWNAVLNWHEIGDYCFYMQIEQGPVCFKIGEVSVNRSSVRNHYHKLLMRHCAGKEEIRRPSRFGCGEYMTIAYIEQTNWLGNDDSLLDMDKVVVQLNHYERLYADFMSTMESLGTLIPQ